MRWRLLLSLAVLGCVGLTATAALVLLLPRESVSQANYQKIKTGMAEREVLALLGEPVGREDTAGQAVGYVSRSFWHGEECMIEVHFDDGGCVLDAYITVFPVRKLTLWERVRANLGW